LAAPETIEERNKQFKSLSHLLTTIAFLADIYGSVTYAHGKVATVVLTALAAPAEAQTIADIGEVYRWCLSETILLKRTKAAPPLAEQPTEATMVDGAGVADAPPAVDVALTDTGAKPAPSPNQKAVSEVISQIPLNLVPLLQCQFSMLAISVKAFALTLFTCSRHQALCPPTKHRREPPQGLRRGRQVGRPPDAREPPLARRDGARRQPRLLDVDGQLDYEPVV